MDGRGVVRDKRSLTAYGGTKIDLVEVEISGETRYAITDPDTLQVGDEVEVVFSHWDGDTPMYGILLGEPA